MIKPKTPKRSKEIPEQNKAQLRVRSGNICEACGKQPATEMHHRKYKSRGGTHDVWNLLHLCGWGNHTGCHGIAHSKTGESRGLSVNSWDDPLDVPVLYADGWHRLEGTERVPIPEIDAVEYMVLIHAIEKEGG